uniref:Uncharacterized protein n=2 Tax=Picea sitchensis TaxID=3332 RepID=A9NRV8_PICSI|nr:unknown [Picea sitchensis]ACN40668.1 unknown [Picea sitchensis]
MTEPPFVPRDYVFRKQQYYQNIRKHTYLKGPYDKITSVVIPITLAVTALSMIGFQLQKKMTEPPFVPRDYVFRKQQYYQNIRKHTYLKGPYDKITSVVIPITLAVTALSMIGRGIYNMSHGIGKKE